VNAERLTAQADSFLAEERTAAAAETDQDCDHEHEGPSEPDEEPGECYVEDTLAVGMPDIHAMTWRTAAITLDT